MSIFVLQPCSSTQYCQLPRSHYPGARKRKCDRRAAYTVMLNGTRHYCMECLDLVYQNYRWSTDREIKKKLDENTTV